MSDFSDAHLGDAHLSKYDPELEQVLQKHGVPKPFLPTRDDIAIYRKRWAAGTKRFAASPLAIRELGSHQDAARIQGDIIIPGRDGHSIRARTYTPRRRSEQGFPLLVLFHGGGYCLGGLDTEEFICQLLCDRLKIVVLNVEYCLAPEHPFPAGFNDAYDSVVWANTNAATLHANLRTAFLIGGISGGATFATSIAHLLHSSPLSHPITGVLISSPILSDVVTSPASPTSPAPLFPTCLNASPLQNASSPLLGAPTTAAFWSLYRPDWSSPLYTPFLFPSHAGHPPAYFQICGLDPFRDGAFIYAKLLRDAGIRTRVDFYKGLPHGFWAAYPGLSAAEKWVRDIADGVGWLLKREEKEKEKARM